MRYHPAGTRATDRGQWFWFRDDLTERRGTAGCFSAIPTGAIGTTLIGLRTIPSPAFWGTQAVEAWRAVPSGTSTFEFAVVGQLEGPSRFDVAFGPDRLWVRTDRLFSLLMPDN